MALIHPSVRVATVAVAAAAAGERHDRIDARLARLSRYDTPGDQELASPYSNSTSISLWPSTRPLTWWISHPTLAFPFWSDLMVIWITPLPAAALTVTSLLSDLPLVASTSAGLILCVTTIDSPALTFTTLGSVSGAYSCFLPSAFLSSAVTIVTASAKTA